VCCSLSQHVLQIKVWAPLPFFKLQCVSVYCNVWQCATVCRNACTDQVMVSFVTFHVAVYGIVSHCVAECCSVLQCFTMYVADQGMSSFVTFQIAVCCSVLQCAAVCCSVVAMRVHIKIWTLLSPFRLQCVALHYSVLHFVLQRVVMCCSVFHRVAVCYSVLLCVAMCAGDKAMGFYVIFPVAMCCRVLQCVACVAVRCSVQCAAVYSE